MARSVAPVTVRRHIGALAVGAAGCVSYVAIRPATNDLANARFREWLFDQEGFNPWNNRWFAGHHTPGYSVLSAALSSLFGSEAFGVLAVMVSVVFGSLVIHRLAETVPGLQRPRWAASWFGVGCLVSLFGGRIAFVGGVALGTACMLALVNRRIVVATGLALLATLVSPVCGAYLAMIGVALAVARRAAWRTALPTVAALVVPVAVVVGGTAALFADPGSFPFPLGGLVNLAVVLAAVWLAGRRFRFVPAICGLYLAAAVGAAVIDSPVGGNVVRLAALCAGPALVMTHRWKRPAIVPVAAFLIVFQWSPVLLAASGKLAEQDRSFFDPVIAAADQIHLTGRIEVVPLRTHLESEFVAERLPIARGWTRQLDRGLNPLFFEGPFDAALYRHWLEDNAVQMVAVPTTEVDLGGRREVALLRSPPSYLMLIDATADWTIYQVIDAPPLASGGAIAQLGIDFFQLSTQAPMTTVVRVHFSPWFEATGDGCVAEAPDGWTQVTLRSAGTVSVAASFSVRAIFDRDGTC